MSIHLQLVFIIFFLISGAIAIVLANRIMRKYPLPYLSSYFYFLIFFFIFGVYSLIGSQIIEHILELQQSPPESIRSAEFVLIVLGIPFLILAWYMFLRVSREFFKQEIPTFFVILYFLLFALSFTTYGLMNLNIGGMETINFFLDEKSLIWTFSGLMILVFGYALISIVIKSRSIIDINQKNAYRWFSIWYFFIVIASLVSLHFSHIHIIFGIIFIGILLGSISSLYYS